MPVKKSKRRKASPNRAKKSSAKSTPRPKMSARRTRRKASRKSVVTPSAACLTGNFEGDIHANGHFWIAKGAKCKAKVQAPSVQVDGNMKGFVHAKNTMKLGPSSQMQGTIVASRFVCSDGAAFVGNCKIGRYRKAA